MSSKQPSARFVRLAAFALWPLVLTLPLPTELPAQTSPGAGTTGVGTTSPRIRGEAADARNQAPIGHRQPRPSDRPAAEIPRDASDDKIERLNRDANRSLRGICRNC